MGKTNFYIGRSLKEKMVLTICRIGHSKMTQVIFSIMSTDLNIFHAIVYLIMNMLLTFGIMLYSDCIYNFVFKKKINRQRHF